MRYATATAFRRALEERLRISSHGDGALIARDRKRVVFDRFLARLMAVSPGGWMLKGGFALDLRLEERARTTKDIDLAWSSDEDLILDTLIDAVELDLGDYFAFQIERAEATEDRFGGARRFRVTATVADRLFENFLLDVGLDFNEQTRDLVTTTNLLEFAEIGPTTVPTIPLALQLAEKLHAYTRIYEGGRTSTRTKDLIDIALIAELFTLDAGELTCAIETTFLQRSTHAAPGLLPSPPTSWRTPYRQLASSVGIVTDLDSGYADAAAFLDPILQHAIESGRWIPAERSWTDAAI